MRLTGLRAGIAAMAATCLVSMLAGTAVADSPPQTACANRPAIKSNRWEEDWSKLADPATDQADCRQPMDLFKYIPLMPGDPKSYLSFGANIRERFEFNDAPAFGTRDQRKDAYLLDRKQFFADLHLNEQWQIFGEIEDDRTADKKVIGPADEDRLDLRLAFLAYTLPLADGAIKARIGRQDFDFDLQRFVSSRDGPNVRQSFDALWADWETGPWRLIGFVSQPVQYRNDQVFDDHSNQHQLFHMLRLERQVFGTNELSTYYARYQRDDAHVAGIEGDETRNVLDLRFAGKALNLDWDIEGMGQAGDIAGNDIFAWGVGARLGYTMTSLPWTPRLGLQLDAASGDRHPDDRKVETFNPLFPNGYYFTLAGYTGYSNLFHVKPSVTVKPRSDLSLMGAVGLQWRESTADSVYAQGNAPIHGTAGEGGHWSGVYEQIRLDWAVTRNLAAAVEAVHYQIGNAIRDAGGHDSTYLGTELKLSW